MFRSNKAGFKDRTHRGRRKASNAGQDVAERLEVHDAEANSEAQALFGVLPAQKTQNSVN